MQPTYVSIDPDLLRRLYVEERLTADAIAARLGCAPITVFRRLRRFGIPVRPRGPAQQAKTLRGDISWSPTLAWVVGLIATDGNLARDGRHLTLVSADRDMLVTVRDALSLTAAIIPHTGRDDHRGLRLQWVDRHFYQWLVGIGLTPAKSLTLRPLAIPDAVFPDFLRGCIDGDGSITVYVDRYNTYESERYVYERLYVRLFSASRDFLDWTRATVHRLHSIVGSVAEKRLEGKHPFWELRYAKQESIELLRWIYYYSPAVPCLARKRAIAEPFLRPLGSAPTRPVGRPRAGWVYNSYSSGPP